MKGQSLKMSLYINPVLSNRDYGIFRIGGPGLANCMFVVARAVVSAAKLNATLLRPAWERIGIGQWIRGERDKRLYIGLFKQISLWAQAKKLWLMLTKRHIRESETMKALDGIIDIKGLGNYFVDFLACADSVRQYFRTQILPQAIMAVPKGKQNVVAIHVRLGDFPEEYRTKIEWYVEVAKTVARSINCANATKFWLFSDGTDEELRPLLNMPNVERVYFGNALADIVAISRSKLLIGSDSTFSGWGAFLGNVPCVFAHVHYGGMLEDGARMLISADSAEIAAWIKRMGI